MMWLESQTKLDIDLGCSRCCLHKCLPHNPLVIPDGFLLQAPGIFCLRAFSAQKARWEVWKCQGHPHSFGGTNASYSALCPRGPQ